MQRGRPRYRSTEASDDESDRSHQSRHSTDMKSFQIKLGERTYSGSWHVDGKDVCVSSAYGSLRKAVGRRQPALVAHETLAGIVKAQSRH